MKISIITTRNDLLWVFTLRLKKKIPPVFKHLWSLYLHRRRNIYFRREKNILWLLLADEGAVLPDNSIKYGEAILLDIWQLILVLTNFLLHVDTDPKYGRSQRFNKNFWKARSRTYPFFRFYRQAAPLQREVPVSRAEQ